MVGGLAGRQANRWADQCVNDDTDCITYRPEIVELAQSKDVPC